MPGFFYGLAELTGKGFCWFGELLEKHGGAMVPILEILPSGLAPKKACSLWHRHCLNLELSFSVPQGPEGVGTASDCPQQPLILEGHSICHTSELFICRGLCSKAKHVAFALPGASGGVSFRQRSQNLPPAVSALMIPHQKQPSLVILYKINPLRAPGWPSW